MHRGFNIQGLSDVSFSPYKNIGEELYKSDKQKFSQQIESYEDRNGRIDASKISSDWFPTIEADVFLSHSHKDYKLVVGFAGWLKQEFNLHAFIDAAMWGYADDLLKKIDDVYSLADQNRPERYDYSKRNNSTSHVHMMLTVGLAEMINQCEAIFFINTPSSIEAKDYLGENMTVSPWIFAELAMMRLIEKSPPRLATESSADGKPLKLHYPVDLSHLTKLIPKDLRAWQEARQKVRASAKRDTPRAALDTLYNIHPREMHG